MRWPHEWPANKRAADDGPTLVMVMMMIVELVDISHWSLAARLSYD